MFHRGGDRSTAWHAPMTGMSWDLDPGIVFPGTSMPPPAIYLCSGWTPDRMAVIQRATALISPSEACSGPLTEGRPDPVNHPHRGTGCLHDSPDRLGGWRAAEMSCTAPRMVVRHGLPRLLFKPQLIPTSRLPIFCPNSRMLAWPPAVMITDGNYARMDFYMTAMRSSWSWITAPLWMEMWT